MNWSFVLIKLLVISKKYKWSIEKAITTPVMSKNEAAKKAVEARRRKKEVGA